MLTLGLQIKKITEILLFQQIPVSLHKLVSDRIVNIIKGKDPNTTTGLQIFLALHSFAVLVITGRNSELSSFLQLLLTAGSTYCTRVSTKAYSENAQKNTKEELWSLIQTIHENSSLSSKEKRRLLGQFYKGHPEIFVQYFGNRLSSVNMLLQWYLLVEPFMYFNVRRSRWKKITWWNWWAVE